MQIEVVYVEPGCEFITNLELPLGATVKEAIQCSKLLEQNKAVSLQKNTVGIFGKEVALETKLQPNDRVEVYRPLSRDPKDSRRLRVKTQGED